MKWHRRLGGGSLLMFLARSFDDGLDMFVLFSMMNNGCWIDFVYQVIIIKILLCQRFLKLFIDPFQSVALLFFGTYIQIGQGCHLRIQISVPHNKLFIFNLNVIIREFGPSLSFWAYSSEIKFVFILRQLTQETRSHFQVLSPRVHEL